LFIIASLALWFYGCGGGGSGAGDGDGPIDRQFVGTWTNGGQYASVVTVTSSGSISGTLRNSGSQQAWTISGSVSSPPQGGSVSGSVNVVTNGQADGTMIISLFVNESGNYQMGLSDATGPDPILIYGGGSSETYVVAREG
jgi:hypothetical protein